MRADYILFDASNTLIHKPALWQKWMAVLKENDFDIDIKTLKANHKLVSEIIQFPDRTDSAFYHYFNAEVLKTFGIIPEEKLLTQIFEACTYLPWEKFEDTKSLYDLNVPIGILSNFKSTLPALIAEHLNVNFKNIFVSETEGVQKPSTDFFKIAIEKIGLQAENIMYVGDSLKLDVLPAKELGMQYKLIDRDNIYPNADYIIRNLAELA